MGTQRSSLGLASFHFGAAALLLSGERNLAALLIFPGAARLSSHSPCSAQPSCTWALHFWPVRRMGLRPSVTCWARCGLPFSLPPSRYCGAPVSVCIATACTFPTATCRFNDALRLCFFGGQLARLRFGCFCKLPICLRTRAYGFRSPHPAKCRPSSNACGLTTASPPATSAPRRVPLLLASITRFIHFLFHSPACTAHVSFRFRTTPFPLVVDLPESGSTTNALGVERLLLVGCARDFLMQP